LDKNGSQGPRLPFGRIPQRDLGNYAFGSAGFVRIKAGIQMNSE